MKRFAVLAALTLVLAGCKETQTSSSSSGSSSTSATTTTGAAPAPAADAAAPAAGAAGEITLTNGLKYVDLVTGGGAEARPGNQVRVHYTGTLTDGTEFDTSRDGDEPLTFRIGDGTMVRGVDEGVRGMKVGGRRKLTLPPSLAYGERGYPPVIPPNATLVFDVELVDVR